MPSRVLAVVDGVGGLSGRFCRNQNLVSMTPGDRGMMQTIGLSPIDILPGCHFPLNVGLHRRLRTAIERQSRFLARLWSNGDGRSGDSSPAASPPASGSPSRERHGSPKT